MDTMGNFLGHTPNGMGLATTAILASLFDVMIDKGILERRDVGAVLGNAHAALSADYTIIPVVDAMDIVSKLAKRFQENI